MNDKEYVVGCIVVKLDTELSPELNCALDALGYNKRETCEDRGGCDENGEQVFHCSKCGTIVCLYNNDGTNTLLTPFIYDYPRYCPSCGAKVVSE